MAKRTYHGSCHCKRIRYEADLDLAAGTGKCNCTYCWKARNWSIVMKPADFRLLCGEADRGRYGFRDNSQSQQVFCTNCGIRVYTEGNIPEIGGAYVSVALATLDDLPPGDLVDSPVRYMNGREDDWFHTPAETRHL